MEVCSLNDLLKSFERQICDIQGRVFELSFKQGYDSKEFISNFMNSQTAFDLDRDYDRLQWLGEEYILANLVDEMNLSKGELYSNEVLYWIGYTYRYWRYLTGESSKEIYAQADAKLMNDSYLGFHTIDVALAIINLKEIHRERSKLDNN